jgi:hypothetical protein
VSSGERRRRAEREQRREHVVRWVAVAILILFVGGVIAAIVVGDSSRSSDSTTPKTIDDYFGRGMQISLVGAACIVAGFGFALNGFLYGSVRRRIFRGSLRPDPAHEARVKRWTYRLAAVLVCAGVVLAVVGDVISG